MFLGLHQLTGGHAVALNRMAVPKYQAPDGGYGWVILVTSFLGNFITASLVLCYSLLMVELAETFDVDRATAGSAGSLAFGVASFTGILHSFYTVQLSNIRCAAYITFQYSVYRMSHSPLIQLISTVHCATLTVH